MRERLARLHIRGLLRRCSRIFLTVIQEWLNSRAIRRMSSGKPAAMARRLETVFTLDRRDFSVYRTTDGRALGIVPEA